MQPRYSSRRDFGRGLTALLGVAPFAACDSGRGTSATGTPPEPPEGPRGPVPVAVPVDLDALNDALGLALAAVPFEFDSDGVMSDLQGEIDALVEAEMPATARVLTTSLNDVITPLLGSFGAAFPANGGLSSVDSDAMAAELVGTLQRAGPGLGLSLTAALGEIDEVVGTDSIPASATGEQQLRAHEQVLRAELHGSGLSGQAGVNAMLHELQRARSTLAQGGSISALQSMSEGVLGFLPAPDDTTRRQAGRSTPRWRAPAESPPPDELADACDTFASVSWLVDLVFHMGLTLKSSRDSTLKAIDAFLKSSTGASKEIKDWAFNAYIRWLATDLAEVAVEEAKSELEAAVRGVVDESLSVEDCDMFAAILLTLLWVVDLVKMLMTVAAILFELLLPALGLASSGLAYFSIVLLLLAVMLYFIVSGFCAAVTLRPAIDVLAGRCTP